MPQASSFWRRPTLGRVGGLREDLHFAMDVDLGLRLAMSAVLPVLLDEELAVRADQEDAKSQAPSRWEPESARIRAEFGAGLLPGERFAGFCFRAAERALSAVRGDA